MNAHIFSFSLGGKARQVFFLSFGAVIAAFCLFFTVRTTSAATCTYGSNGTTNFNLAANWDCGFVPGASSTAIVPASTSTALSADILVADVQIGAGSTFTTTGFHVTTTGSVTSSGSIVMGGANSLSIGRDLDLQNGGTLTAGNGTILFSTSTTALATHNLFATGTVSFNNLVIAEPGGSSAHNLTVPSLGVTGNVINILGNWTLVGDFFATTHIATITVTGTTSLGTSTSLQRPGGATIFNSTTTNAGTIGGSSGTFTFNGDLVNTGNLTLGSTDAGTWTINKQFTNSGSGTIANSGASSTFIFSGTVSQAMPVDLTYYNLTVSSTAQATLAGNVTTTNNFTLTGGNLSTSAAVVIDVFGDFVVTSGTMSAVTQGQLRFLGSDNQSIGAVASNPHVMVINKTAGTATFTNSDHSLFALRVENGTLNAGTATTTIAGGLTTPFLLAGGTFLNGGGTVQYSATTGDVASTTYNNLVFSSSGGAVSHTINASTTVSGTLSLDANSTLAIGTQTLNAPGTIMNNGTITISSGGTFAHPVTSAKITDSSGTEVSSLTTAASVYLTVIDSNRNLLGATVETITIPVSMNSAAGSDAETITLTETSVNSGVFRNSSAINLVTSSVVSSANSQFEITASGTGTSVYTDAYQSSDTASDSVTVIYAASSGSGGGGGLGSSGGSGLPPLQTTFQTNQSDLTNLQNLGIAIHSLLKLPDDGDTSTQIDTAVYYIGADGKRHAFPNDKVYFSWYADFGGVQVINGTQLATIPLGKNVTYKPGVKMVKFTSDNKVYAVAKGGVLRWIKTESAAIELYGSSWNTQIDDINDAFYINYIFGNDIVSLADFNPVQTAASVTFVSDSL